MAKGARGGRRAATISAATGGGGGSVGPSGPITFGTMSSTDAKKIWDDNDDKYDPDALAARKLYISKASPNNDGFSYSQNLNYKLNNGLPLDPTEKYINDNLQNGMHDLGKNATLTRYCHDGLLKQFGITDYSNMTQQQLQSALVGATFETTAYTSYSYDSSKNPFRPGVAGGNGREVTIKTNSKADTKVIFGAKDQAEVVLNKGTKQVIKNIYFDGTQALPRLKSKYMPRIVIETETI